VTDVVVVETGTANLASVLAGLERAGARPRTCAGPLDVERADRVVVPGVGTLASAMDRLVSSGLAEPLRGRVLAGKPTLCVCLGLQVLAASSEESPGVAGLGVVAGTATRFASGVRIPQIGWNMVEPAAGSRLIEPGHAYFANSYKLDSIPQGWAGALADHGGPFVAALERGAVLACQFHPELSGRWGLDLLQRWLSLGHAPGGSGASARGGAPRTRTIPGRVRSGPRRPSRGKTRRRGAPC